MVYTFQPHPGLESRPDRILLSKDIRVHTADLSGDGKFYRDRYSGSVIYHRLRTVIHDSYLSYNGTKGYSCVQDCGPNGSCRCGVCVKGGNQNSCLLPDCVECNSHIYKMYITFIIIAIIIGLHLFYSIVVILVTGSDFRREEISAILGCNCCLCNNNLFRRNNVYVSRRHRLFRICHKWPLFQLPPYLLWVISMMLAFVTFFSGKYIFHESLRTIYSVMDEEYFPSDHRMLIVKINV